MVIPSGPGAPRFAFTFFHAAAMLAESTIASIKVSGIKLRAGCSARAATVDPGRDNEPVVSSVEEGFPRSELADDSSLFFIVRSFPSRLVFEDRYFDLG